MPYYSFTVIWPETAGALWTTSIARVGRLSCAVEGGYVRGQITGGRNSDLHPQVRTS